MAEFIDEAYDFYGPLGATKTGEPVVFTFKSGAKIYTNHLADKNAFEKYKGWGLTKIGIEELTQIEEEKSYRKLLGSLRAKKQIRVHGRMRFRALRSQILSTTNPDGEGRAWVKKRFVKCYDGQGQLIPWNTPIRNAVGVSRIFIPMPRKENPYLRDNKQYESMINDQDEITRRQWVLGDWDAGAGSFFPEWRPHGPVGEEEADKFPWARHVIDRADLQPYWYRWGGGDWGYDHPAVFHKFCRSEKNARIHCYDELILRGVGSFEMGVKLAEWWLPDLEFLPDKMVTVAFSPDAFNKIDVGRTKGDQIIDGMKTILGPYGAFLLKYTDEERALMAKDEKAAAAMFSRRIGSLPVGEMRIMLKPASRDRAGGFSYMRELLRFRPVIRETEDELTQRLRDTYGRAGVEAYEREVSRVRRPVDDVLPKLQVWSICAGLIRCMEEAMHDEDKPEDVKKQDAVDGIGGDDPLESGRYALRDFRDIEKVMPKAYYVSEQMEKIQAQYELNVGERLTDPTRLIMVQQTQAARYDGAFRKQENFTPPRASSMRHRTRGITRR